MEAALLPMQAAGLVVVVLAFRPELVIPCQHQMVAIVEAQYWLTLLDWISLPAHQATVALRLHLLIQMLLAVLYF